MVLFLIGFVLWLLIGASLFLFGWGVWKKSEKALFMGGLAILLPSVIFIGAEGWMKLVAFLPLVFFGLAYYIQKQRY
ncbi:hypothetical protein FZC66_05535 [Priestia megaterium]|nr:hypothetical protein FZC66_05535 [Priestia megaterium]